MKVGKVHYVGCVGVDAGLVMIGDPCYHLHKSLNADKDYDRLPKAFCSNWQEFYGHLSEMDKTGERQLYYDMGHAGLAVIERDFGGDGCYPVFIEKDGQGLTKKLIVDFQPE